MLRTNVRPRPRSRLTGPLSGDRESHPPDIDLSPLQRPEPNPFFSSQRVKPVYHAYLARRPFLVQSVRHASGLEWSVTALCSWLPGPRGLRHLLKGCCCRRCLSYARGIPLMSLKPISFGRPPFRRPLSSPMFSRSSGGIHGLTDGLIDVLLIFTGHAPPLPVKDAVLAYLEAHLLCPVPQGPFGL